jgi:zinc and cadmium transporter
VSFVGISILLIKERNLKDYIFVFMSLAVGALLGDAFIHLIPEAFESISNPLTVSLLIIGGILLFFIIEKFFHWHHHGEDVEESHIHPTGKMILVSDGIHNFIDGIIIGVSYLVSVPVGIATTVAVILHEIPQEMGDFSVLIHSGYTKYRALWLNFASSLVAVLGVLIVFLFGESIAPFAVWIAPVAAGGFIYVAIADLIPELHKTKVIKHSLIQLVVVLCGIGAMIALLLLE